MSLSSFFSSFVSTVYADSPEEPKEEVKEEESKPDEAAEEPAAEEEEEEEPEDIMPEIVEACKESKACATATHHFAHCEEKVNAGQGYPHEDCVEEFMMHCVNSCVAPKLFEKLK
ncbi:hypothetical protein EUX98_g831 [Antrodiella citrinella]|uniref:Ubiquinol-cytochrome C reductase hinge domain-containing protein n=1 Tax=Antrodiella citrinella TaxID=2447956 RepID=A0A4S4N5D1_9APHY|nr:hypothetical protein EUX98_g831 [Antrodiella citrinella]